MNPVLLLLLGAGYGFLAGNPKAREETFMNMKKLAGTAIDALNKKGGAANVPAANEASTKTEE